MRYNRDKRIVMTLDAGGTNFVFTAVKGEEEIIEPISLPSHGESLEYVLKIIVDGFKKVQSMLSEKPVAISFSFPGPAEYERGIIGNLVNLPVFRGGVALGQMLEDMFRVPVLINNDGDLFTYGEAIAGFLPWVNELLEKSGSPKRFQNLLGGTFGTGFGGGIVHRGKLFFGDNSAQGEINRMRNRLFENSSVEESVSIRGVKRVYAREAGVDLLKCPSPKDIFEIGIGRRKGSRKAAVTAFEEFAIAAADAFANAITLIDGLIVMGGGLSGAHPLFMQKLVDEMNSRYRTFGGSPLDRLEVRVFNLEDSNELDKFIKGDVREITVPFSEKKIEYDPLQRVGIGISRLGTVRAVSIGAYTFALSRLDGDR